MLRLVTTLRLLFVGACHLYVASMSQNHLEKSLGEEVSHVTMHCIFNEYGAGHADHSLFSCSFCLLMRMCMDRRNIGILMLLEIVISLALLHELAEVAIFRRDESNKIQILKDIRLVLKWDVGHTLLHELG